MLGPTENVFKGWRPHGGKKMAKSKQEVKIAAVQAWQGITKTDTSVCSHRCVTDFRWTETITEFITLEWLDSVFMIVQIDNVHLINWCGCLKISNKVGLRFETWTHSYGFISWKTVSRSLTASCHCYHWDFRIIQVTYECVCHHRDNKSEVFLNSDNTQNRR